jgi:hypothetical protein
MTSAVLTSRSPEDVIQIDAKGYWDHSHTPLSLNIGDTVYITVNETLRKTFNVGRRGIVKSISKAPPEVWTSQQLGNSQTYRARIELDHIKPADTEIIEDLLKVAGKKQNTSGIMYLDHKKRYSK